MSQRATKRLLYHAGGAHGLPILILGSWAGFFVGGGAAESSCTQHYLMLVSVVGFSTRFHHFPRSWGRARDGPFLGKLTVGRGSEAGVVSAKDLSSKTNGLGEVLCSPGIISLYR